MRGVFYEGFHCYSSPFLSAGLPEGCRRDEVVRFLETATLMKGIQHDNILPVLRISVEDNYVPLVIYPTVEYGNMHRLMMLASDPEHNALPVSILYIRTCTHVVPCNCT